MMARSLFRHTAFALGVAASTLSGTAQSAAPAKNVIIFMGDGTGLSSLNAASIYGYNKPQSLFIQSLPGLALSDTSTATQWGNRWGRGRHRDRNRGEDEQRHPLAVGIRH